MKGDYILEMNGIKKSFPGVKALDNVHLRVRKGTVHALMGENGAGKSTLMKILMGIYNKDEGKILFKGESLDGLGIRETLDKGISMIHQELSYVPHRTVAENIFLGREPMKGVFIDEKALYRQTQELLDELDMDVNPRALMVDLTTAYAQMTEIAKAIACNSDLIIMDEPTSAITEKEAQNLFKIIDKLKKRGVSIIYITHKLDEVFQITDEATVLRDGQYIGTELAKNLTTEKLIAMMVGREITEIFPKTFNRIKEVVLSVKNLSKDGVFENISFDLRRGEILGFAGLMGAGRSEVMEAIFGVNPADSGEIFINDKKVEIRSSSDAINHGIGFLTEDRKVTGCFLPLNVMDNMIMSNIKEFRKGLLLSDKDIFEGCKKYKEMLNIKTPNIKEVINNLSGGNQQKVLLARWLMIGPDILILDEPTKGIDVGAKSEIHKLMCKLTAMGKSIIMVSSEMPEILGMSDRVVVMYEGKLTGILDRKDATQEVVMTYATGSHEKTSKLN